MDHVISTHDDGFKLFYGTCGCLDIQCFKTFNTLIVAAVDITDSFLFRSTVQHLGSCDGESSRGLLEADVAIANAAAAVDVLLL